MDLKNNELLIKECQKLEHDCLYTAEVHYLIASKLRKKAFWFKLLPALITVVSIIALLLGSPNWVSWFTLISSIIIIINVLNEPDKKSNDHLFAAKSYTSLKHEARALHECFKEYMNIDELKLNVKNLRDKYSSLVNFTPMTDDEKCWEKARKRIKSGVHSNNRT